MRVYGLLIFTVTGALIDTAHPQFNYRATDRLRESLSKILQQTTSPKLDEAPFDFSQLDISVPGIGLFDQQQCDDKELIRRACRMYWIFKSIPRKEKSWEELKRDGYRQLKMDSILAEKRRLNQKYPSEYRRSPPPKIQARIEEVHQIYHELWFDKRDIHFPAPKVWIAKEFHEPIVKYEPHSHEILIGTSLLNYPRQVHFFWIAHESGHGWDPAAKFERVGKRVSRATRFHHFGNGLVNCFNRHYLNEKRRTNDEDFADLLASIIANRFNEKLTFWHDRLIQARGITEEYCAINELTDLYKSDKFSTSPIGQPISFIFRQPSLRKSLGCLGLPIENDREVTACGVKGPIASEKFQNTGESS